MKALKTGILQMLAVTLFALVACGGAATQKGTLEGVVSISPITPVESTTPSVTSPEIYAARKILIYDNEGKELLHTVSLDDHGYYNIELPAGIYMVDINHTGIDLSTDVPKSIEIERGVTVELDISIDTGIR